MKIQSAHANTDCMVCRIMLGRRLERGNGAEKTAESDERAFSIRVLSAQAVSCDLHGRDQAGGLRI